jgi:hypothetical protein
MAVWPCFGQPSQVQALASGRPRDVAWAAYTIARENRQEMAPNLAALVASYQGGSMDDRATVPPEVAAIEAVADALIQLQAKLPAETIMHLYPQLPAQAIILLSRASDNAAGLLEIFRSTRSRDLWLAAGNLLAIHPPPGFARSLLDGVVVSFVFRVVPQSDHTETPEVGSGCAGDFLMAPDEAFRDWPKARMYRLDTGEHSGNIFAPGIHSVGFGYWETTDYRDPWGDGDCSRGKSKYWRTGLLAQLQGKNLYDFSLKSETEETVPFSSVLLFEDSVRTTIQKQFWAFGGVVQSFLQAGVLSTEDSLALDLKCRIEIQDARPWPRMKLPPVEGRWCTPAPPKPGNLEPPE